MKLKNKITVTLYETEGNIKFSKPPGIVELARAKMLLDQVLQHNFSPEYIEMVEKYVLDNTTNIEEVPTNV